MLNFLVMAALCVPANWAVIEAIHHGEIFASLRAWLEAKQGFLPELLTCPFCLSYWTPLPLLLLCLWHDLTIYQLPTLIPLSFAVTRMSNLLNDVLHKWCRTPRVEKDLQSNLDSLDLLAQGGNHGDGKDRGSESKE